MTFRHESLKMNMSRNITSIARPPLEPQPSYPASQGWVATFWTTQLWHGWLLADTPSYKNINMSKVYLFNEVITILKIKMTLINCSWSKAIKGCLEQWVDDIDKIPTGGTPTILGSKRSKDPVKSSSAGEVWLMACSPYISDSLQNLSDQFPWFTAHKLIALCKIILRGLETYDISNHIFYDFV